MKDTEEDPEEADEPSIIRVKSTKPRKKSKDNSAVKGRILKLLNFLNVLIFR